MRKNRSEFGQLWKENGQKVHKTWRCLFGFQNFPKTEMLLFGYFRKIIDHQHGFEMNFGDSDVLRAEIARK